ncbi:PilN domain-containing protein [Desulfovirgula thermocuniculi]|uniref:PilN domain-containing protein n=1 Tax=Desulfovirgula thermocuniculi TaxID=348842 RepID=UPI0003F4B5AE|nr:PilN domain-containing protein [Desulfovirgula thermocuniculi]
MNYRVNLLPAELQPRPPFEPKRLALISLPVLVGGALVGGLLYWRHELYKMRVELEALRYQVPRLQQAVNKVEEMKKERQVLEARAGELEELIQRRRAWSSLLADLAAVMPDGAWLNALQLVSGQAASPAAKAERAGTVPSLLQGAARAMEAGGLQQPSAEQQGNVPAALQQTGTSKVVPPPESLNIEGSSRSLAAVGVLLYHLQGLPYFSGIELNEVKYDEGKGVYNFSITARLRGDGG